MASLGNVGVRAPNTHQFKVAPSAVLSAVNPPFPLINYPVNGRISGVVSIGAVPTAGVLVRLYYRDSGALIEQAISGTGGTYSFSGLNTSDTMAYYVTFHDPKTSAPFNYTVTKDHLTAG